MLHVLLLTAVWIIQTVVVIAREDVHCNYQQMLTAMKGIYAVWSSPPPFACKSHSPEEEQMPDHHI